MAEFWILSKSVSREFEFDIFYEIGGGGSYTVLVRGKLTLSARLAQSVERKALNLVVVGSSPTVGDCSHSLK